MKTLALTALAGAFALVTAHAKEIGKAAPDFTAKNAKDESVSLADLKGKVVVLEWVNFECPFVKKHYESGNLPKLQEKYTGQDVVWISINTAAEGKQGHIAAADVAGALEKQGSKATEYVFDTDGKIGKAYDAKTTPQLFIIDKEGTLVYDGAIDSKPTTEIADVETAEPWFANALDAVLAGEEVANAKTQPYGCSVKY